MPADRWDVPALYPWNERGTVVGLVVLMTEHETADHCDLVKAATTSASAPAPAPSRPG